MPCTPSGALTQHDGRPWWPCCIAKIFARTLKDGLPTPPDSSASGRQRHAPRRRSRICGGAWTISTSVERLDRRQDGLRPPLDRQRDEERDQRGNRAERERRRIRALGRHGGVSDRLGGQQRGGDLA